MAPLVGGFPGAIYAFSPSTEEAYASYKAFNKAYNTHATTTQAQREADPPAPPPRDAGGGGLRCDAQPNKRARLSREQRLDQLRGEAAQKKPKAIPEAEADKICTPTPPARDPECARRT